MTWKTSSDVVVAAENAELVLLHMGSGQFFGLDAVGSRIWHLLQKTHRFEQVVEALHEEYGVEREILSKDVRDLLTTLRDHDLIQGA